MLLGLIFMSNLTWAWGPTGHRIVAEIAENHLNHKAKKEIQKIIGKQSMAYWATWGDFVKSDPAYKHADSWHYVNFPADLNRTQFDLELKNSSDKNLYKRIQLLIQDLKNRKNLTEKENQENLYFLIHLLGDLHQPLHIGREEDMGGNKINVKWFNGNTNLHTLWDSKLIDFQKYSYSEYAHLLDIYSKKEAKHRMHGTLEDWLFDSHQKANRIYASVQPNDKLSYRYNYDHVQLLEEQLLQGGLRMAKVLNEIFG